MRWGEASAKPGALNWVRPLHSIVATFGPETEEPEVVPFDVDGIAAGDTTYGHRFLAPAPIKVRRLDDYMAKLEAAKVVVDPARRAEIDPRRRQEPRLRAGLRTGRGRGLLAEVAGLVEWPVVLMGAFDKAFLAIPEEVIRATIRNNQKCFVVRDPHTAKLANKFILVSNIEASDGGKAIIAGNERVIRARLSDAKFFYETDLKTRLEDRLPKFEHIVFHEKLGTQAERIARIVALAGHLAPLVGADVAKAERAAQLCKADLLTEVVGEFPELQGLMGRYYAEAQGEDEAVAHAIEDHYKPKGPDDLVPADPVSVAVALADKIDMLVGFWAIDEKPTGIKDPYALRRAALGVIRIVLDNELDIVQYRIDDLQACSTSFRRSCSMHRRSAAADQCARQRSARLLRRPPEGPAARAGRPPRSRRCRVRAPGQDDLVLIVRRVEALGKFLDTDDGKNLLAGYQARRQHPPHRGEEGQHGLHRRARRRALSARPRKRRWPAPSALPRPRPSSRRRARGFRRRHDRDVEAAPARRCVLRQGHGQRRRQGAAREPAAAAQRDPRGDPRRGGFLEDRRRLTLVMPALCRLSTPGMTARRGWPGQATRS